MNIPKIFPKASIAIDTDVETDELIRRIKKSFNLNPKRGFVTIFFIEREFFQGELNGLKFKILKNDSFRSHSNPNLFLGTEIKGEILELNGKRLIELTAQIDSTFRGLISGFFVLGIISFLWSILWGSWLLLMGFGTLFYLRKKTPENLDLVQQKFLREILN